MELDEDNTKFGEVKHSHLIQATLPITFVIIWVLDTQLFSFSIILDRYVPSVVRLVLFIIILSVSIVLMKISHDILFKENEPSDRLIVKGIFNRVRNPFYLGILLVYVSLLFLSISIICIVLFFIIVVIYNKMVNYEEKVLEELFGDEYLAYKRKTPKWIPKLF